MSKESRDGKELLEDLGAILLYRDLAVGKVRWESGFVSDVRIIKKEDQVIIVLPGHVSGDEIKECTTTRIVISMEGEINMDRSTSQFRGDQILGYSTKPITDEVVKAQYVDYIAANFIEGK